MKLTVSQAELSGALSIVSKAAAPASTTPVLTGVSLSASEGQLVVVASDNDMRLEMAVPAEVADDGRAVIPAGQLTDLVRRLPNGSDIVIAGDADGVDVTCGRAAYHLGGFNPETFPARPARPANEVRIDAAAFVAAARQVLPAALSGADNRSPALRGVLFEPRPDGVRLVATDSYRLAARTLRGVTPLDAEQVLLPAAALNQVVRVAASFDGDLIVRSGDWVLFEIGDVRVWTRTISAEYPRYEGIIPTTSGMSAVVDVAELTDVVGRMASFAKGDALAFEFADGQLVVSTAKGGTETIDVDYDGDPIRVGFNPSYLSDAVALVGSGRVRIQLLDTLKPVRVTDPADDELDYLHVVMPHRLG